MVPCAKSDRYTPEVFSQSWKVVGRCSHHGLKVKKDPEARQQLQLLWGMHKNLATFHHQWQKAQIAMVPRRSTYHPFPEGPDSPRYLFPSLLTGSFQWKGRDEKVEASLQAAFLMSHQSSKSVLGFKHKNLTKASVAHYSYSLYFFCSPSIQSFDTFSVVFYWSVTTLSLTLNSIHSLRRCQLGAQSLCLKTGNAG